MRRFLAQRPTLSAFGARPQNLRSTPFASLEAEPGLREIRKRLIRNWNHARIGIWLLLTAIHGIGTVIERNEKWTGNAAAFIIQFLFLIEPDVCLLACPKCAFRAPAKRNIIPRYSFVLTNRFRAVQAEPAVHVVPRQSRGTRIVHGVATPSFRNVVYALV